MANEQNIIPHQFTRAQDREEAAKNGKKGGRASGAARRAKRDAKDVAEFILSLKPSLPPPVLETMQRMGMKKTATPDMRYIATLAIMQKAMKGDHSAYQFILNLAGETARGEMENIKALEERRRVGLDQPVEQDADIYEIRRRMDKMTDEQLARYEELCNMFADQSASSEGEGDEDD